jgi:hypothetical protein
MKIPITTEDRIFVERLKRDLKAKQALGAGLLVPGTKTWEEAVPAFLRSLGKEGPVEASRRFRAGVDRLTAAQKQMACRVNAFLGRSRSGIVEVLIWEAAKHPLIDDIREGVIVRGYLMRHQRTGRCSAGRTKLAFLSWHALARMAQRSKVDILEANAVVAGCGYAGMLMRESEKHINTSISYATEDMTVVGVLRAADTYAFYDVRTILPHPLDEEKAYWVRQRAQGVQVTRAVVTYVRGNDSDPTGRAGDIPVIPFDDRDYISIQLRKEPSSEQTQQAPRTTGPTDCR